MSKILANQIANYLDNAPIEIKEGLNIPSGKPLQVGGSTGTNGQVLSTNGTGLVWADAPYFSGSYNDLTNLPTIPAAQVNADWNAVSGVAVILNKPAIPPQSSVTIAPAQGGGSLIYNNINGEFTYTPPNLSGFSTFSGNYNDLNNKPDLSSYLTSYTETDPVFTASPVGSVTNFQVTNWNTAYGWGNHASAGYLTAEADTLATVVARGGTTTGNIQVNDLTVSGNFSVIGTSTTNNVATLNVAANQIIMNDGVTGSPTLNGVLKVERGTLSDSEFRWNETSDRWEFSNDGTNFYNLATGNADLANTAGYITTYTETDPLFTASAASGIGASDIADWNTAYGWGNHASVGYLTVESDTLDNVVSRGSTTSLAATFGDLTCTNLTVTGTTTQINTTQLTVSDNTIVLNNDVSTTPSENAGIEVERGLSSNVRLRWNEATDRWTFTNDGSTYFVMPTSIGDLANDVGYLTSYTETDPIFSASIAAGIGTGELSNWNSAYNWGNHASAGYLTGLSSQSIGGLGDVNVSGPATGELLRYNATSSKWENWSPNFSNSFTETDPVFSASPSAGITNNNINNWNTAFSWGNHADAGYLTSYTETGTLQTVTDNGSVTTNAITSPTLNTQTINLTNTSGDTILGISYGSANDDVAFTFSQTGGTGGSEVIYFLKNNAAFKIRNTSTAGTIAKFTANGNNELYYDDAKKFETTSTGATVTGDLNFTGDLYQNGVLFSGGGGATVAGSDTQVQYNDNGSLGASAALTFIDPGGLPATRRLQVGDDPGNPSQNFVGEIVTDNINAQGTVNAVAGGYFGGSVLIEGNAAGTSLALTTGASPVSITDNNYSTGIAGQVLTATGDDGGGNATGVVWANTSATASSSAPSTATSTGTAGTIAYDADYIYVCVATNSWKRASLTTW